MTYIYLSSYHVEGKFHEDIFVLLTIPSTKEFLTHSKVFN